MPSPNFGPRPPGRAVDLAIIHSISLPPGRYGVTVIHDKNANGKLDSNIVGIPTEPDGASRDARGRMGAPAFEDAAVDVQGDTALTIHVH